MYNWDVYVRDGTIVVIAKRVDIIDGQLVFRDEQGMIIRGFNQTHWVSFIQRHKAEH